jgi:predicted DNA-binding transcriptional regulator AlpA
MRKTMKNDLLTLVEVMEALRLSRSTVLRMAKAGTLTPVHVTGKAPGKGRPVRFKRVEVEHLAGGAVTSASRACP